MSGEINEYGAQIAERVHAWRKLPPHERGDSAAELIVHVLELFQRDGVTPQVQMMALMAGIVAKESGHDNLRTKSTLIVGKKARKLTIGEAMEALSAGKPIPEWNGAAFSAGERKRKQHYVWQHYLSAWTNSKNQIWCLRKDGSRPFPTGTDNIAHRAYFYKIQELNDSDIACVRGLFGASPKHVQDNAERIVAKFNEIFKLRREYEARQQLTDARKEVLETLIINFEEDLHARIEDAAVGPLAALRCGDMSFMETDSFAMFAQFLALQHLRTAGVQERLQLGLQRSGINAGVVNVLRHIFADTIGFSLFSDRHSLHAALLESPDGDEFITGDQPVHNTLAAPGKATERLQLYYPVSPKLALLLTTEPERPGREHGMLSHEEVVKYNAMVERVAHEQVFASRESLLAGRFIKHAIEAPPNDP